MTSFSLSLLSYSTYEIATPLPQGIQHSSSQHIDYIVKAAADQQGKGTGVTDTCKHGSVSPFLEDLVLNP